MPDLKIRPDELGVSEAEAGLEEGRWRGNRGSQGRTRLIRKKWR